MKYHKLMEKYEEMRNTIINPERFAWDDEQLDLTAEEITILTAQYESVEEYMIIDPRYHLTTRQHQEVEMLDQLFIDITAYKDEKEDKDK